MSKKAILFDLDGTLLPMVLERFTSAYMKLLAEKLSTFGYDAKELIDAVWKGVAAMTNNDGAATNAERFWEVFAALLGERALQSEPVFREFYCNEFDQVKAAVSENALAPAAVAAARKKGCQVILATNPLFPLEAVRTRLAWIGLKPEDFDAVTTYDTESFCKPNSEYYTELLKRLDLAPQDCLMIGNDELEDMYAAAAAGIDGYLVTDCKIASKEHPWQGKSGSFADMVQMLEMLP